MCMIRVIKMYQPMLIIFFICLFSSPFVFLYAIGPIHKPPIFAMELCLFIHSYISTIWNFVQLKDRSDQSHWTWEEVYRIAKRNWTLYGCICLKCMFVVYHSDLWILQKPKDFCVEKFHFIMILFTGSRLVAKWWLEFIGCRGSEGYFSMCFPSEELDRSIWGFCKSIDSHV